METSELNSFEAIKEHCIATYEQLKVQMTRPRQSGSSSQHYHYMAVAHSHASRKSLRTNPIPPLVFDLTHSNKIYDQSKSKPGLLGYSAAAWNWATGILEITALALRSINSASSLAGELLQFLVLKAKEEYQSLELIKFVDIIPPRLVSVRIKVDKTQKRFVTSLGHLGFYVDDTPHYDGSPRFTYLTVKVSSLLSVLEERMTHRDLDFLRLNGLGAYLNFRRSLNES